MINLIFSQYENKSGPGKVAINTVKGLQEIGIPFTVNSDNQFPSVFLQDHPYMHVKNLSGDLVGPNICVLPPDNRVIMEQKYKKCLVPSSWVFKKYSRWLDPAKLAIWAVGIDTESFAPSNNKSIDFLVYFKRRDTEDLNAVCNFLKSKGFTFKIVSYGNYSEEQFKECMNECRYAFLIDRCESQGIAVQEMMSCNLPILVWDVNRWADRGEEYACEATSIPYFTEQCGVYFYDKASMNAAFDNFMGHVNNFEPRKYIIDNFSLKHKASDLMRILYD
jgi:glycosyltransferase involved in cell wall biosynthesis